MKEPDRTFHSTALPSPAFHVREHKKWVNAATVRSPPPPTTPSVSNMRSFMSFAALFSVAQALSAPGLLGRASQDNCGHVSAPLIINRVAGGAPLVVGYIGASLTCSQVFGLGV